MTSLIYSESLPEPMPVWVCQKSDSRFAKRFAIGRRIGDQGELSFHFKGEKELPNSPAGFGKKGSDSVLFPLANRLKRFAMNVVINQGLIDFQWLCRRFAIISC